MHKLYWETVSSRLKHKVKWLEDLTLKGSFFHRVSLESCGYTDTQEVCSHVCTTPATPVVTSLRVLVQALHNEQELSAGNTLVLTGEGGCFLSIAAKSTSLYSFPGWLSTFCLILASVQKWKSTGFVVWPPGLFIGCPRGKEHVRTGSLLLWGRICRKKKFNFFNS